MWLFKLFFVFRESFFVLLLWKILTLKSVYPFFLLYVYSKDRQFRIEHRDKDGNVEGQYGFYDLLGKMNLVKYTSRLNEGFRSEKVT